VNEERTKGIRIAHLSKSSGGHQSPPIYSSFYMIPESRNAGEPEA